jgi:MFS family permease
MGLVAFMAFQGPFDSASPAAGFVEQSKAFGVPTAKMLDSIGPHAIFLGIGGLLWVPLAHRYGRSPIYVCAAAVATLGALGCALSNSLGAFIGARVSLS